MDFNSCEQQCCYDDDRGHDDHAARLDDHADDFRRINQVVNSDEIEIRIEFLPEEELANGYEQKEQVHEQDDDCSRITALPFA